MKKHKTPMKLGKGTVSKLTKDTKSSSSFGDKRAANPAKTKSVKSLVAKADVPAIKTEKSATAKDRKKRLEGLKF